MGKSSFKPFCHTFASDSNHEPRRRRPPIRNPLIPQMRMDITNKDLLPRIETIALIVFLSLRRNRYHITNLTANSAISRKANLTAGCVRIRLRASRKLKKMRRPIWRNWIRRKSRTRDNPVSPVESPYRFDSSASQSSYAMRHLQFKF